MNEKFFKAIESMLPAVFSRKELEVRLNGLITKATMSAVDSQGRGPKSQRFGNKIVYVREDFMEWFREVYKDGDEHASGVDKPVYRSKTSKA